MLRFAFVAMPHMSRPTIRVSAFVLYTIIILLKLTNFY